MNYRPFLSRAPFVIWNTVLVPIFKNFYENLHLHIMQNIQFLKTNLFCAEGTAVFYICFLYCNNMIIKTRCNNVCLYVVNYLDFGQFIYEIVQSLSGENATILNIFFYTSSIFYIYDVLSPKRDSITREIMKISIIWLEFSFDTYKQLIICF